MDLGYLRLANKTLADLGLDGHAETGENGLVALHDRLTNSLVIENEAQEILFQTPIDSDLIERVRNYAQTLAAQNMSPHQLAALRRNRK